MEIKIAFIWQHSILDDSYDFVHLHLSDNHPKFQEFFNDLSNPSHNPETHSETLINPNENSNIKNSASTSDDEQTRQNQLASYPKAMVRYLVADARPADEIHSWATAGDKPPFTSVQSLNEHLFAYKTNLVYVLSADLN